MAEQPKTKPRDYFSRFPTSEANRGEPGRERNAAMMVAVVARALESKRRQSRWNSQKELARDAGVSEGTLSRIESGSTWPDMLPLLKITDMLGLELGIFPAGTMKNLEAEVVRDPS